MGYYYKLLCFSTSIAILSGCAVGPDYARTNNILSETNKYTNQAHNNPISESMAQWWSTIDDPALNEYIDQLLSENLQLKQAGERILQARARTTIAGGDFYPSVDISQSAGRTFTPTDNNFFTDGNRQYSTNYTAELSTSWQIDLFGRLRRNFEASRADFIASQYDKEALTHTLIAELVQTKVNIAIYQELLNLAKKNTQNRDNLYKVVKRRYNLGTGNANASDVHLAENNFNQSKSDIFQFERLLTSETYKLDLLLGQKPGTTYISNKHFPLLPPPQTQAVCLPADLLDRRPDIRASELRVKAANANIGVAIADLYPNITIGGSLGFTDSSLNNFFTAEQLVGSLLGTITTRIFEGGKLRANIRLKESQARELSAAYAENILNALKEVETSLHAEEKISQELESKTTSLEALKKAEDSTQIRYLSGIETLQNYLDIQQRRYQTEQSLLNTQREKWQSRISLYLALGGDWTGSNTELNNCQKENSNNTKEI